MLRYFMDISCDCLVLNSCVLTTHGHYHIFSVVASEVVYIVVKLLEEYYILLQNAVTYYTNTLSG